MKNTRKILFYIGIYIIAAIFITALFFESWMLRQSYEENQNIIIQNVQKRRGAELELIREDLQTYGTLSPKVESLIITTIDSCSKEYEIPIGLLHCIFRVESDYRFNIDHPDVTVPINGKMFKTHAIGLGGVMWCYWKDSLRTNNIAVEETDLYLPDINIRATSYILSFYIKKAIKEHHVFESTILNEVIKEYYGAYNSLYMSKMEQITSDLWLKRIARNILTDYVKPIKK